MGTYSVPDSIRKMKPVGTMVKTIKGRYYVYKYKTVTDETGKRKTVMGKCIGSISEERGFVPNDNFARDAEITSLEFGQYAVVLANSQKTLKLLQEFFHPDDALRIYCTALIQFLHGFADLTEVGRYYEMSYLSLKYPGLKLGDKALSSLYDELGREQSRVLALEKALSDTPDLGELLEGTEIRDTLSLADRSLCGAPNPEYFSQNGNACAIPVPDDSDDAKKAAPQLPDGSKTQGFAFIMLIEALIRREFGEAMREANLKGKTIRDCLLDARLLKIQKHRDSWQICNCRESVLTLFEQLHTPLTVDAAHT